MAWQCPYAIRLKSLNNGLACRQIMNEDVDYNLQENAMKVLCACQRYCPTEKQSINSDGAKKCYGYHSQNQRLDTVI